MPAAVFAAAWTGRRGGPQDQRGVEPGGDRQDAGGNRKRQRGLDGGHGRILATRLQGARLSCWNHVPPDLEDSCARPLPAVRPERTRCRAPGLPPRRRPRRSCARSSCARTRARTCSSARAWSTRSLRTATGRSRSSSPTRATARRRCWSRHRGGCAGRSSGIRSSAPTPIPQCSVATCSRRSAPTSRASARTSSACSRSSSPARARARSWAACWRTRSPRSRARRGCSCSTTSTRSRTSPAWSRWWRRCCATRRTGSRCGSPHAPRRRSRSSGCARGATCSSSTRRSLRSRVRRSSACSPTC